jgi:beta-glucanase (GH16 family)
METYVKSYLRSILIILCLMTTFTAVHGQCPTVVWGDEFEAATLDLTKWSYQIGDGCQEGICGWGNNELQYYKEANVTLANGQLHITAKKERVQAKSYTSGRIRTLNKGEWTYGRFEARIKLPAGKGLWPAFWMLPTDEVYGGWPQSGEIDIMEFVAADPTRILGTIHYGDPWPNNRNSGAYFSLHNGTFPDAFHNFAIEWEPGIIRWFVDDVLYVTKTSQDLSPYQWPFDQRFHFLLNVAVGGNLGGPVDDSIFPKVMDVDYVRVYNGFKAYITGKRLVANQENNVAYSIGNVANNTNVNWTVPLGATIVSGQGTSQILVNFGSATGNVSASFNTACGTQQLNIGVVVEPAFSKEFSFENFDTPSTATLGTYTGTLSEVSNPSPSGVNTSALVGRYVRNSSQQYDVLVYNVTNISDASQYSSRAKKFYMDVYTNAPVGTEILLQLETATATSSNYPTGRHSRYVGRINSLNQWQRIAFELLDKPDGGASSTGVTKMILLFASNTFTGDTYYYDNLDSYSSGPVNSAPVVSISAPANNASFPSGTAVNVTATATDSDGTISQVEFFANGSPIGTDSSSPFAVNWTIGVGNFALTAKATDNAGTSTTSSAVNVTGTSTSGSYLFVNNIATGTQASTGGSKFGTATITVRDNSGNPVSNATVTGTFSGTFSETKSGTTGADGTVKITTTAKAKGTVTVNFCVTGISHSTLTYNSAANVMTCSGGGARAAIRLNEKSLAQSQEVSVKAYPNPFEESFDVTVSLEKESLVEVKIYNTVGKEVAGTKPALYSPGIHKISFANEFGKTGLYFVRTLVNKKEYLIRQVKSK